MARKIEMRTTGTPDALSVVETEVGLPGAGKVRLVQTAIGINYVDVMVRKGLYPMRLPATPGFEAAGVEALPGARKSLYNWQRNSKVFVKGL